MNYKHPILEEAERKVNPLLQTSKGNNSYMQIWKLLYATRTLKYVSHEQYFDLKFSKVCALDRLRELCNMGYLDECKNKHGKGNKVFTATDEVLPILSQYPSKFNIDVLPTKECKGNGDINEILNTKSFISAFQRKDFYALLYPQNFRESHDLVPDALLVLHSKEERKYRLIFLEIEAKKPRWIQTLEEKRDKYLLLAKDYRFYNYWKDTSEQIKLPVPNHEYLKFSVAFVCTLKNQFFGDGFEFVFSLSDI